MSRNKRRRTRNHISNQRLRSDIPYRYVPLSTSHLLDLAQAIHGRRLRLLPSTPTVRSRTPVRPLAPRAQVTPSRVSTVTRPINQAPARAVKTEPITVPTKVCASRHERREVLFAFNKTGKGGQKKPRWTKNSYKRCKR